MSWACNKCHNAVNDTAAHQCPTCNTARCPYSATSFDKKVKNDGKLLDEQWKCKICGRLIAHHPVAALPKIAPPSSPRALKCLLIQSHFDGAPKTGSLLKDFKCRACGLAGSLHPKIVAVQAVPSPLDMFDKMASSMQSSPPTKRAVSLVVISPPSVAAPAAPPQKPVMSPLPPPPPPLPPLRQPDFSSFVVNVPPTPAVFQPPIPVIEPTISLDMKDWAGGSETRVSSTNVTHNPSTASTSIASVASVPTTTISHHINNDIITKVSLPPQQSVILTEEEAQMRMVETLQETMDALGVTSADDTVCLLRAFRWDDKPLLEAWTDERRKKKARILAGLLEDEPSMAEEQDVSEMFECPSCNDIIPSYEAFGLDCRHLFCEACWSNFVTTAFVKTKMNLNDILTTTFCPSGCPRRVGDGVLMRFLGSDSNKREALARVILKSFVSFRPELKCCPVQQCKSVACFVEGSVDMKCLCGLTWCFECGFASHSPCSCALARQWREKDVNTNKSEKKIACFSCTQELMNVRGAYRYVCDCGQGCCWLCQSGWADKSHVCSMLSAGDPYWQFVRRHFAHLRASNVLRELIKEGDTNTIQDFHALEEVLECRRVIAWGYAFSYYLAGMNGGQRVLFDQELHALEVFIANVQQQAETQHSVSSTLLKQLTKYKQVLLETMKSSTLQNAATAGAEVEEKLAARIISQMYACDWCTGLNPVGQVNCSFCEMSQRDIQPKASPSPFLAASSASSLSSATPIKKPSLKHMPTMSSLEDDRFRTWFCVKCTIRNLPFTIACEFCNEPRMQRVSQKVLLAAQPKESKSLLKSLSTPPSLNGQNVEQYFMTLADLLLNKFELVVNTKKIFRLVEIEFYFLAPHHQDTFFTSLYQLDDYQRVLDPPSPSGTWHFRRAGSPVHGYFREGGERALDISFGCAGASGGILLRSLQEEGSEKVFEGPAELVHAIQMAGWWSRTVSALMDGLSNENQGSLCITNSNRFLYLRPAKDLSRKITALPRVALSLQFPDSYRSEYIFKPYRFTTTPNILRENLPVSIASLYDQQSTIAQIKEILCVSTDEIEDCLNDLYDSRDFPDLTPVTFYRQPFSNNTVMALYASCVPEPSLLDTLVQEEQNSTLLLQEEEEKRKQEQQQQQQEQEQTRLRQQLEDLRDPEVRSFDTVLKTSENLNVLANAATSIVEIMCKKPLANWPSFFLHNVGLTLNSCGAIIAKAIVYGDRDISMKEYATPRKQMWTYLLTTMLREIARPKVPVEVKLCEECEETAAELQCSFCGVFCETCAKRMHSKGQRKTHELVVFDSVASFQKEARSKPRAESEDAEAEWLRVQQAKIDEKLVEMKKQLSEAKLSNLKRKQLLKQIKEAEKLRAAPRKMNVSNKARELNVCETARFFGTFVLNWAFFEDEIYGALLRDFLSTVENLGWTPATANFLSDFLHSHVHNANLSVSKLRDSEKGVENLVVLIQVIEEICFFAPFFGFGLKPESSSTFALFLNSSGFSHRLLIAEISILLNQLEKSVLITASEAYSKKKEVLMNAKKFFDSCLVWCNCLENMILNYVASAGLSVLDAYNESVSNLVEILLKRNKNAKKQVLLTSFQVAPNACKLPVQRHMSVIGKEGEKEGKDKEEGSDSKIKEREEGGKSSRKEGDTKSVRSVWSVSKLNFKPVRELLEQSANTNKKTVRYVNGIIEAYRSFYLNIEKLESKNNVNDKVAAVVVESGSSVVPCLSETIDGVKSLTTSLATRMRNFANELVTEVQTPLSLLQEEYDKQLPLFVSQWSVQKESVEAGVVLLKPVYEQAEKDYQDMKQAYFECRNLPHSSPKESKACVKLLNAKKACLASFLVYEKLSQEAEAKTFQPAFEQMQTILVSMQALERKRLITTRAFMKRYAVAFSGLCAESLAKQECDALLQSFDAENELTLFAVSHQEMKDAIPRPLVLSSSVISTNGWVPMVVADHELKLEERESEGGRKPRTRFGVLAR